MMRWNTEQADRSPFKLRARSGRTRLDWCEALEARQLLAVDLFYAGIDAANSLPGTEIVVNSTVENRGDTVAADDFTVKFYLSQNNTFDAAEDTLLGSYTNDVDVPAMGERGFPVNLTIPDGTANGDWFIIGIADSEDQITETDEANNRYAATLFVGNRGPTIGVTTASPSTVGTNGIVTFRAFNVADADEFGDPVTVRFFYDDGDEVFSEVGDTLIGNATLSNGVYTFRGPLPNNAAAGERKVLVVASDGLDRAVALQSITVVEAASPTLGDLTAPATARRGREITLTASNIQGMTPSVEFFRDANGNGTFEAGEDLFLGVSDDAATPTKSLNVTIDPAWGPGDQTFFARAIDALGQPSNIEQATVDLIANRRPLVARLVVSPNSLSKGQEFTLTARNVRDDDGPVTAVRFYRESSGNSTLNPDQDTLLGEGVRIGNSNNWSLTLTAPNSFRNGLNRFYVRAVDVVGDQSFTKTAVATISRNERPAIESFNINKNSVGSGGRVTFLATNVTDNGGLDRVEFWFDANNNGRFDARSDRLITLGQRLGSSDNWRRQIRLPDDLPDGQGTYFAVAVDNLGVRGPALTDTLRIT